MADVTIYTRMFCPYCSRAVALLKEKGVDLRNPRTREEQAIDLYYREALIPSTLATFLSIQSPPRAVAKLSAGSVL